MVKQTWLSQKPGHVVALKVTAPKGEKRARFDVVSGHTAASLGFDHEAFSKRGNATCPFCGTVADSDYVKAQGVAGRMGAQLMSAACRKSGSKTKVYLCDRNVTASLPDETALERRLQEMCATYKISVPSEPIINDAKNALFAVLYGLRRWGDLFTKRQLIFLITLVRAVQQTRESLSDLNIEAKRREAILAFLAILVDRSAQISCTGRPLPGRQGW